MSQLFVGISEQLRTANHRRYGHPSLRLVPSCREANLEFVLVGPVGFAEMDEAIRLIRILWKSACP